MLCERILGYLHDDLPPKPIDWVDLTWQETLRRTLRKRSQGGREIGILLPIGQRPTHGAILHDGDDRVVVQVLPADVYLTRPSTLAEMGRLALELGNLHAPVQITSDTVLTVADGPAEEVLHRLGLPFLQCKLRFEPTPILAPVTLSGGFEIVER